MCWALFYTLKKTMDKTKIPTFMEFLLPWEETENRKITKLCSILKGGKFGEKLKYNVKESDECSYK